MAKQVINEKKYCIILIKALFQYAFATSEMVVVFSYIKLLPLNSDRKDHKLSSVRKASMAFDFLKRINPLYLDRFKYRFGFRKKSAMNFEKASENAQKALVNSGRPEFP